MDQINKLRTLLKQKKSKKYYANQLGVSELEIERMFLLLRHDDLINQPESIVTSTASTSEYIIDIENGTSRITKDFKEPIRTLEELIKNCDIDIKIWKIDKYVQNFWGSAENPNYQVKAFLSKIDIDTNVNKQKDVLLEEIANYQRPTYTRKSLFKEQRVQNTLLEISLPDIHIGKLGWHQESGEDYDIDIAVQRYRDAIDKLLSRINIENVEKIHLPLGNDAIHIDNSENTTTAGTAVDTDGRFPKILRAAKKLFIETIDRLRLIAPVDVSIIRGNHDSQTMFLLGDILDAWYRNDDDVNILNAPKFRKYYKYGECGFLFTHGDKEKHSELGLTFATEEPNLWAETKFRFCKLGHLHKSKKTEYVSVDTFPGFQIEILPSLSGTDEWHYAHGYLANKQGKAFLYHKTEGEIAAYTITI